MRIATILGTRPEIIRLSRVIPALDPYCAQILVHTGQNYDPLLSEVFFSGLGVRPPDVSLGVKSEMFGDQVAQIITGTHKLFEAERPDRVVILGDTNSGLAGFVACRMGIPVYHMEAGNRCFDDRVPEEVNRRVIDHSSTVLMPYTERSRANLIREGVASDRIHVIGNPINEVLESQADAIDASEVLETLGLSRGRYFLCTTHRQENVDVEWRLQAIAESLNRLRREYDIPVIWTIHPRTRSKLQAFGVVVAAEITVTDPFGFHDFVSLEKHATCVLSDSGTVQEECCIMRVPTVTLRDVTERPETVECGSNILAGVTPDVVLRSVGVALATPPAWDPPAEYLRSAVSDTVAKIVLGYQPRV